MYPSGIAGIGVGAGGATLAATGFMFAGFMWAGLIILLVGLVLFSLAGAREVALRRRRLTSD